MENRNEFSMCCLFNFMQYVFGFFHKFVTAFLCCVVGYVVCCVMLFAVTAGVALGYNYSVSEYMEHKDTNVSVQLQRGIFPEKADNMRRRAGGGDVDGAGDAGSDLSESMTSSDGEDRKMLNERMQKMDEAEAYERNLQDVTSEKSVAGYQSFDISKQDSENSLRISDAGQVKPNDKEELLLNSLIHKLISLPGIGGDLINNQTHQPFFNTPTPSNPEYSRQEIVVQHLDNRLQEMTTDSKQINKLEYTIDPYAVERTVEKRADFRDSIIGEKLRRLILAAVAKSTGDHTNATNNKNSQKTIGSVVAPSNQSDINQSGDGNNLDGISPPPNYDIDDMDDENPKNYRPVRRRRSVIVTSLRSAAPKSTKEIKPVNSALENTVWSATDYTKPF